MAETTTLPPNTDKVSPTQNTPALQAKHLAKTNAGFFVLLGGFAVGKKGKGAHDRGEPKAQTAGAYPGFIGMKHLGVFLLPPGRDASPSQGYPPALCRRYPFIHLREGKQIEVKFLV